MYIPDVIGDVELYLLKFWDSEDVGNHFFADKTLNGIEVYLLVGGGSPSIEIPK